MSFLITGGAGFIGSNLAMQMSCLGFDDVVVVDFSEENCKYLNGVLADNKIRGVSVLECDYSDPEILSSISSGVYDQIIHLAAIPRVSYSVENPSDTTRENIFKFSQLLEASIDSCDRVVFASSSSVYGGTEVMPTPETETLSPQSPYALQKKVGEEMCSLFSTLYGVDTVSFRFFNVFGPHQFGDSPYSTVISAWLHAIMRDSKLRLDGTGEVSRDFCYVTNVCDVIINCLKSDRRYDSECFNVACGDRISLIEILDYFKEEYSITDDNIAHAPPRKGDVMHTCADMSKMRSTFNIEKDSQILFWEGLKKTEKWWKKLEGVGL